MTAVDEKKGWPEGYVEANGIRLTLLAHGRRQQTGTGDVSRVQ